MVQKLRNHLCLAFLFLALSLLQQYAFYSLKSLPIIWLTWGKYLGFYVFFFIFSFTPGRKLRLGVLSFLLILNFFQMAHLSYFGTQILPNEIYLFFTQFHEITGTLAAELHHIFIPFIFTVVPILIGYYFVKKYQTSYQSKWIPVLIALYAIYNPLRTYFTGNTWGRQPSTRELDGMNFYLSLSYGLGKIIPHKLEKKRYSLEENESLKLKVSDPKKSRWDNIIVVLGESQTPHHMSLFNYSRPTTPFLNSLKKDPRFFHTIGLSSGVSTDISVAFFMNMGYGDAGAIKAAKGEHCLFRLAKKNHFSTHFLSTQSSEQLRYISPYLCSAYLDDHRSLEDVSPKTENSNAAIDRDILPKLKELLEKGGNKFIILHQRGSHGPWELRSTPKAKIFTQKNIDSRINDYDNSVVEFDFFWKELHELLLKQDTKNLVLYISDHGEYVGENNLYGHGFLQPNSFEIPLMVLSYNQELPARTRELPSNLPQYNFALYLVRELGWETNQDPHTVMKDFVIYGNDIDGFAGKATIHFGPLNKYKFKVIP